MLFDYTEICIPLLDAMIRVLHPDFTLGPYCATLSTQDCADCLLNHSISPLDSALDVIFLGCGCAALETELVREMLKRGCNVTKMLFVHIAVTSDTIHNIQNLMRERRFTDCFVTTSFESLLSHVESFAETGQTPVVLGIHASSQTRHFHSTQRLLRNVTA